MSYYVPIEKFVRRQWIADPAGLSDRINYACGTNVMPGWLNTDLCDGSLLWRYKDTGVPAAFFEGVFNLDLLQRHPFPDDSFAFAYCEDFIEHIPQQAALLFLSEIYRTLAPGGVVRMATPSLDGVLAAHFAGADYDKVVDQTPAAFDLWGHVHFFSHASLRSVTEALGFVGYTQERFGESGHAPLRGLETRPEQISLNLYAEFRKPL